MRARTKGDTVEIPEKPYEDAEVISALIEKVRSECAESESAMRLCNITNVLVTSLLSIHFNNHGGHCDIQSPMRILEYVAKKAKTGQ